MTKGKLKIRPFLILYYLYKNSDENHMISTTEIKNFLEENGMKKPDAKTLKRDMDFITEDLADLFNIEVFEVKSSPNKFYIPDRVFEISELKMLIDAVSSSHFITDSKSKDIIEKLTSFASESQQKEIQRNIYSTGKIKTDNKKIFSCIDIINTAINENKKIAFTYLEYKLNDKKVYRNNGDKYLVSPYYLYVDEDNYYVLGYSEKRSEVISYRVDRIDEIDLLNEKAIPKPATFDITRYGTNVFNMYGGKDVEVDLEFEEAAMKYIIEKFGSNLNIKKVKDKYRVLVEVALSPTFYAWVFQFSGLIKIVSPKTARDAFGDMIYKNKEGFDLK